MDALIGLVVGVVLTAAGSLLVGWLLDRRVRAYTSRQNRLEVASEVLGALQELNRRLIDLARADTSGHEGKVWPDLHQATIRWNSARLAAALVGAADEVELLTRIDLESDRVMDSALGKQWSSRDFRAERAHLGELGAAYLNRVRLNERIGAVPIATIWSWADQGRAPGIDEPLQKT